MAIAFPASVTSDAADNTYRPGDRHCPQYCLRAGNGDGAMSAVSRLAIANRELQQLALEDGLTRLANRRCFDEQLADEWQRLAREQQPLSLILCDLDHFKRYNDTFGHPAGDRCLIRVARALLNGPQRPADLVARYGGEEFAIVLPNTDSYGAWRIAQKIHRNIRALKIASCAWQ